MEIRTKNVDDLIVLREILKKKHSITATTDEKTSIRLSIRKAAPDDIDSWLAGDEVFDVKGPSGNCMLSEFDVIFIAG